MPQRLPIMEIAPAVPVVVVKQPQVQVATIVGAATEAKQDDVIAAVGALEQSALTDVQLRAAAVAVSAASLPLPSGAATEATQAAVRTAVEGLEANGLTDAQLRASAVSVAVGSALPAGSNEVGSVRVAGVSWSSGFGVSGAAFSSLNASAAAAAVTDAPVSGQHLVLEGLFVSAETALAATFTEETSGAVVLLLHMGATSSVSVRLPLAGLRLPTANKRLMLQTDVSGAISVTALYRSAP